MILVDSNVLIDVLSRDPVWFTWSAEQLDLYSLAGPLFINEVIYAEMAGHATSETDLDNALAGLGVALERLPKAAMYLAGKTFARYRKAGGVRTGVLADFFIGAHAETMGLPILTRDIRHYRIYFPKVALVTP